MQHFDLPHFENSEHFGLQHFGFGQQAGLQAGLQQTGFGQHDFLQQAASDVEAPTAIKQTAATLAMRERMAIKLPTGNRKEQVLEAARQGTIAANITRSSRRRHHSRRAKDSDTKATWAKWSSSATWKNLKRQEIWWRCSRFGAHAAGGNIAVRAEKVNLADRAGSDGGATPTGACMPFVAATIDTTYAADPTRQADTA
ncbi:MAG: hypothetical protein JNL96_02520 [Planctomycetaceae bacterium]|nr:hypothetical protein [Planctomycetaceae bacterium]